MDILESCPMILLFSKYLLSCQPRVKVTSCFVYKVISDLESIDHLCINPVRRIGLIHVIYRFALAQVECKNVLLNNCKQNKSQSLLAGRTIFFFIYSF